MKGGFSLRKETLFFSGVLVFFVLVLATSAFAYENEVKSAAETLAKFMRESGKKTIAVVDFTDLQGNVLKLGRFLAEELSISMASSAQKDFKVVDRTHLRALLKEHQLSLSGLIDPTTAQKVGEISGVEALVTGTITPFGDNVRLALKVIELATADILGSTSVNIGRTQAINELLSREVTQETSILTTQETTTASPSPSPTPSTSPEVEGVVVETDELIFKVTYCGFQDEEFWCGLLITSKKEDRMLVVYEYVNFETETWNTRVITEEGVEYKVLGGGDYHIGDNWGGGDYGFWLGNIYLHLASARNLLPHDIPVQAWFRFPKVPKTVKKIALLEIVYSFNEAKFYRAQLRDIPVSE